ncbi:MAG: ankyrin repeat domain-containing protein [Candidatus Riflebacteria bacterium]|nr:ankyrin repeat domain-containing protein [Candidatus Riflebacteria bacterium]
MNKDYENFNRDYTNLGNSNKVDSNFNNILNSYKKSDDEKGCSCCGCSCLSIFIFYICLNILLGCLTYFIWSMGIDDETKNKIKDEIENNEYFREKLYLIEKLIKDNKNKTTSQNSKKESIQKKTRQNIVKKEPVKQEKYKSPSQQTLPNKFSNPSEDKEWEEAYRYIKNGQLVNLFDYVKRTGRDLSKMYYKGEPGVCIAVQYEQYEIVKYMVLSFDCTKLADKDKKRNALHYASLKGNTKIIELLLQNGFDVDSTDSDGNTPLFYSITYPFPDSVILLLEKGSNPNIQNKDGTTPLHFAIKKSNVLAMEYLMKAGADPNKPDKSLNTPMHYISLYSKNYKTLDVFYDYWKKLDLNAKNKDGKTPRNISYWDYFDYYEHEFRKKFH